MAEIDCGAPPVLNNGTVVAASTLVGGVVTYICDVGFSLVGDALLTCSITGLWEGTTPSCQGNTKKTKRPIFRLLTWCRLLLSSSLGIMS